MSEHDMRDSGALPTLGEEDVLGAPVARVKSKTNVGKLMILGAVLVAFLFAVVGLLFWQRHKAAEQPEVKFGASKVAKPAYAVKNTAVNSSTLEATKAAIREREAEDAKIKADREAQAAAQAAQAQPAAGAAYSGGTTAAKGGNTAPARPVVAGVLLNLDGSRPVSRQDATAGGSQEQQARPYQATAPASAANANPSMENAVRERLAAMGVNPTAAHGSLGGGGGTELSKKLEPTVLKGGEAGRLPDLDYLLKKGTMIPCALQTGIDTTLPGFVTCKVLNDVYSANEKTLLIERGATVFGEQTSALKQGQERTFVLWTRIDNPTGVFAELDSPATDQMGYAGIPGYVDTHFWTRFGGAIMLSMIRDFSTAYSQKAAGTNSSTNNFSYTQQATQDMASEALRNTINVPPTLSVLPGTVVNVMVARDVSFQNIYRLVR